MDRPIAEIKDRLKQAMSLYDITAQQLSDRTKIPKSSISQYLSGYAKPKGDRIHLISKALQIEEAWILGYDVPMTKNQVKEEPISFIAYARLKTAIDLFESLNEEGQDRAIDNMMLLQKVYPKESDALMPIAAHNAYESEQSEQEKMMEDIANLKRPE